MFAARRARRRFMQKLRIVELEHAAGLTVSYPEADLPTIRIVRNPNDPFGWEPWVALGFPGEDYLSTFENGYAGCHTSAETRAGCLRAARARLYGIYLAKLERAEGRELVA